MSFIFEIVMAISENVPAHQESLEICFQLKDIYDIIFILYHHNMAFPGGRLVKNPPASAGDTRDYGSGRSPGGGRATLSRILAWRIPRTEEPGRLRSV